MSRYGSLISEELGLRMCSPFDDNLNEEKAANTKLNTVAECKGVNKNSLPHRVRRKGPVRAFFASGRLSRCMRAAIDQDRR